MSDVFFGFLQAFLPLNKKVIDSKCEVTNNIWYQTDRRERLCSVNLPNRAFILWERKYVADCCYLDSNPDSQPWSRQETMSFLVEVQKTNLWHKATLVSTQTDHKWWQKDTDLGFLKSQILINQSLKFITNFNLLKKKS